MLLFHAILFFLLGTHAVALPMLGFLSHMLGISTNSGPTPLQKQSAGIWYYQGDDGQSTYVILLDPEAEGVLLLYSSSGLAKCPEFPADWEWERLPSLEDYKIIISKDPKMGKPNRRTWIQDQFLLPVLKKYLTKYPMTELNRIDRLSVGFEGGTPPILHVRFRPAQSATRSWESVGDVKDTRYIFRLAHHSDWQDERGSCPVGT